ncbi:MAG: hypothetical protein HYY16_10570 [Planctomycetes bacterium]|nr:hypothetical protein [Planctomycetota bacterium]
MWLIEFRKRLEDALHRLLWRQWTQLGVLGSAEAKDPTLIDPEALCLVTLEATRTEPRLFDEVLDWLLTNGGAMDVQRLRNIVRQDAEYPGRLLAAVSSLLASKEPSAKWRRLATIQDGPFKPEPLFLLGDEELTPRLNATDEHFARAGYLRSPFKPRGLSRPVSTGARAALRFRLRGLFGIGIRAEAVGYLLTHEDGHAREIAQAICYSFPGVQQALREMATSGTMHVRRRGREKRYWIERDRWWSFLDQAPREMETSQLRWIDWVRSFRALAALLRFARRRDLEAATEYVQTSELRRLLTRIQADLESGLKDFALAAVGASEADRLLDAIERL